MKWSVLTRPYPHLPTTTKVYKSVPNWLSQVYRTKVYGIIYQRCTELTIKSVWNKLRKCTELTCQRCTELITRVYGINFQCIQVEWTLTIHSRGSHSISHSYVTKHQCIFKWLHNELLRSVNELQVSDEVWSIENDRLNRSDIQRKVVSARIVSTPAFRSAYPNKGGSPRLLSADGFYTRQGGM